MDDRMGMALLFIHAFHSFNVLGRALQIPLSRETHSIFGALLQFVIGKLYRQRCDRYRNPQLCQPTRWTQLCAGSRRIKEYSLYELVDRQALSEFSQ